MLYLSAGNKIRAFTLSECLGKGGMSAVWRARHAETGKDYALKILHGSVVDDDEARQRFFEEGLIQSRVSHPNVVTIKGRIEEHPVYALVMEFVDGPSLSDYISERPGGLSLPEAKAIATGVLSGLNAAHRRGIVHRDVKPSNVMLARDFYTITPKLTDFGIAKVKFGRLTTVTSNPMGTPHFMSPEQLRDSKRVTSQTDIYSFGVSLYNMLTGQFPFEGDDMNAISLKIIQGGHQPPSYHRDDLPPELDELIERCMAPRSADRPADCREVLESILAIDWNQPSSPSGGRARRSGASARARPGSRPTSRPPTPPPVPATARSRTKPVQRPPVPRPSGPVPTAESGEWRMSSTLSDNEFEGEDLTLAFRRKRSWPMWVALVLLVAAAAFGTRMFLEWQANKDSATNEVAGTQLAATDDADPVPSTPAPGGEESAGALTGSGQELAAADVSGGSGLGTGLAVGEAADTGADSTVAAAIGPEPGGPEPGGPGEGAGATSETAPEPGETGAGDASTAAELRSSMTATGDEAEAVVAVANLDERAGEPTGGEPETSDDEGDSGDEGESASDADSVADAEPEGEADRDRDDEEREDNEPSGSRGGALVGREAERAAEEAWRARQGSSTRDSAGLAPTIRATGSGDDPLGGGEPAQTQEVELPPDAPGDEELTPTQVNRVIAGRRAEFRACFEGSDSAPVEMRIRITSDGGVSFARAVDAGASGQIVSCLVREIGRLQFDSFDGRAMNVRRTFGRVGPM